MRFKAQWDVHSRETIVYKRRRILQTWSSCVFCMVLQINGYYFVIFAKQRVVCETETDGKERHREEYSVRSKKMVCGISSPIKS